MWLPPMPSIAGMRSSIGPTSVSTGFAPRETARRNAAAASFTRNAIAQAEGPCARANCWPKPPGSALMTKLMSPWRCSVTFLLRWRAATGKPMRANSDRRSSGSGAVYSTNSKPSVPIGLSNRSAMAAPHLGALATIIHRCPSRCPVDSRMLGRIPAARQAIIDRVAAIARRKRRRGMPVAPDRLARCFYHGVSELDLVQRTPEDLAAAALAQLELGRVRPRGRSLVRVFNPDPKRDGFASAHTVIMVVTDDMPFLVDSLGMVCTQKGLAVHLLAHPVLSVVRDGRGRLQAVHLDDPPQDAKPESWQMIEIDREPDPARLAAIEASIKRSLDDVRAATGDWRRMRAKARDAAATLSGARSEVREAKALLAWMEDNHFTFLGYREYRLRRGPRQDRLVPVPHTGLGILRRRAGRKAKTIVLTGEIRAFARSRDPLIITKANSVATVHRATYLDYVGVKTFDARGNVTGERRFLGLWTSCAYGQGPSEIPVLRLKVQRVIDHFHLKPSSHDHKALVHALNTLPRDELFQATLPDLVRIVRGIVNLYERAQVRLFVRRDPFRRFYSCLVYVPRDRYNTQARKRIEKLALEAFGGVAIESQVTLSESVLARLHMLVRTPPGADQGVDASELERRIAQTVRTWQDQLKDALLDAHGEAEALELYRNWGDAFPAAYQEDAAFEAAVLDIASLERLVASADVLPMSLYRRDDQPAHKVQFKLFRSQ